MRNPGSQWNWATAVVFAIGLQAAPLYRVSGTVINAQSGVSLPNTHVFILPSGSARVLTSMVTGDDGKFSFDLPEGKYSLRAGGRDRTQVYGLPSPDTFTGSAVVVGPDQHTENLLFRWFPAASITGKITDNSGELVMNALVQLISLRTVAGRRLTASAGSQWTNDQGEYRFAPLPAGTYYLYVTGEPWHANTSLLPGGTPGSSAAYLPAYYPGTPDAAQASALQVASGAEVQADFTLSTTSGTTVSVKFDVHPGVYGTLSLIEEGIGGVQTFQRRQGFASEAGSQTISNVPPGRYTVRATGTVGTSDLSGRRTVEVNGSPVEVELALQALPKVSGTVKLKNPGARPRGVLLVSLIRSDSGAVLSTAIRQDGSFTFPGVQPGTYRVSIRGTDGYFASEIRPISKTEIRDSSLELTEGEVVTLSLVASDETGRVKGFAMNGEQAAAGCMVVLTPTTGSTTATPRGFLTDSDGSFDLEHVVAGEYLLFATQDAAIEYASPNAVHPYLSGAKRIRIEPQGTYSERIPIAAIAPKN